MLRLATLLCRRQRNSRSQRGALLGSSLIECACSAHFPSLWASRLTASPQPPGSLCRCASCTMRSPPSASFSLRCPHSRAGRQSPSTGTGSIANDSRLTVCGLAPLPLPRTPFSRCTLCRHFCCSLAAPLARAPVRRHHSGQPTVRRRLRCIAPSAGSARALASGAAHRVWPALVLSGAGMATCAASAGLDTRTERQCDRSRRRVAAHERYASIPDRLGVGDAARAACTAHALSARE